MKRTRKTGPDNPTSTLWTYRRVRLSTSCSSSKLTNRWRWWGWPCTSVQEQGSPKVQVFLLCFHPLGSNCSQTFGPHCNNSDKEKILRWTTKHEFMYQNVTLRVYQDMSVTLVRKRVAFNDIQQELYRKGAKFGLLHPACLQVTFSGESIYFDYIHYSFPCIWTYLFSTLVVIWFLSSLLLLLMWW